MARESRAQKAEREAREAEQVRENNSRAAVQIGVRRQQNSAVETGRSAGRPADYNLLGSAIGAEMIDTRTGDYVIQSAAGAKQLYIGEGGSINLVMVDGSEVVFSDTKAGTTLNIQFVAVYKEGTTASKLVALY